MCRHCGLEWKMSIEDRKYCICYICTADTLDVSVYYFSTLNFRRLLQMGVYNTELFTNLGLCCFYSQQYDMTLTCFERAIAMATDENIAEVWYNLGHVALVNNTQFIITVA